MGSCIRPMALHSPPHLSFLYLLEQMNCMFHRESCHSVAPRHVTDALCDYHDRGGN